jgi:hypothetical protein
MGQQHRVRIKRKRRKSYLKRKKIASKATQRGAPKAKGRKQPAQPE